MASSRSSLLFRYAAAVGFSILGIVALHLLKPLYSERSAPLILLALPVAATAVYAGKGPGLVATLLCAVGAWGWLIPPEGFAVPHPGESLRITLTVITGVIISLLSGSLHRSAALLRKNEQEMHAVFDHAAIGIIELDESDGIVLANKHFLHLLNLKPDEVRGRSVHDLTDPEDRPLSHELHAKLRDGLLDFADYDKRYIRQDGSSVWVHVTVSPIRDRYGQFRGSIATVADITARKRNEEELARSNRDLEHFANVISHDLQEPVRMVQSFTGLFEQQYAATLQGQALEYFQFIADGAKRIGAMITGLLAYSRVDRGQVPLVRTDVQEIINGVLSNLQIAIGFVKGTVKCGSMPEVMGNAPQLIQLFQNLIGNGLKFRKPDTAPIIYLCAGRQGNEWMFSISDNGIGIDPKYQDRIFELFQRLHTQDEYPGTGIGLAVCKRIVERHGGRIWVESKPGQGTSFFFTLPAVLP